MRLAWYAVTVLFLAAPALADEYDEFRIPDHRISSWSANLSARSDGTHSSSDGTTDSRSLLGSVATNAYWLRDSDPARSVFQVSGSAFASRTRNENHSRFTFSQLDQEQRLLIAQESLNLALEHRWYPGSGMFGYTASANGGANDQQIWSRQHTFATQSFPGNDIVDLAKDRFVQWSYSTFFNASLGVGVGRVRNATPVYDARVFESRLQDAGALSRPLSDRARQRLISLLAIRGAYNILDRPARSLWKEIAAIVAEDGDGEIDPEAVFRALEPHLNPAFELSRLGVPSSPVLRLEGWFAGPVAVGSHSHFISRVDVSSYRERTVNDTLLPIVEFDAASRTTSSNDRVLFGPQLEFHRPIGVPWQIDGFSRALMDIKDPEHSWQIQSSLSASWLLADRWLAAGRVLQARDWRSGGIFEPFQDVDFWNVFYGASLQYYLQDRIELSLSVGEAQGRSRYGSSSVFFRQGAAVLSVGYRLLGRIEAPGLIQPIRVGAL